MGVFRQPPYSQLPSKFLTAVTTIFLSGSIAGVATDSATLQLTHDLSGSSAAVATCSATAKITKNLSGSSAGLSSDAATANVTKRLSGSSSGIATDSASATVGKFLSGSSAGASTVLGTLGETHDLRGTSAGSSTASATVDVTAGAEPAVDEASGGVWRYARPRYVNKLRGNVISSEANAIARLSITVPPDVHTLSGDANGKSRARAWLLVGVIEEIDEPVVVQPVRRVVPAVIAVKTVFLKAAVNAPSSASGTLTLERVDAAVVLPKVESVVIPPKLVVIPIVAPPVSRGRYILKRAERRTKRATVDRPKRTKRS